MTTITNYTNLLAAVRKWYEDRSDVEAYAIDFVSLAEIGFSYELTLREQQIRTTLIPTDGTVKLPTDYQRYINVTVIDGQRRIPLDYIDPKGGDAQTPQPSAGGTPQKFSIIGEDLLTYPWSTHNLELTYYQHIPPLTEVSQSNWLLARAPNLYLRASLFEAASFFMDDAQMTAQGALKEMWISKLQAQDEIEHYAHTGIELVGATP